MLRSLPSLSLSLRARVYACEHARARLNLKSCVASHHPVYWRFAQWGGWRGGEWGGGPKREGGGGGEARVYYLTESFKYF